MLIIPAIDIIDGKCVRLTQGEFDTAKIYSNDPVAVALDFQRQGAKLIHIVDLTGSKNGVLDNYNVIKHVVEATNCDIQIGGGIRSLEDIERYIKLGVTRIVIGSKALKSLSFVKKSISKYGPDKIVIAIDTKDENVAIEGWLNQSNKNFLEFAKELKKVGVENILFTDITRDGTLTAPNYEALEKLQRTGLKIIASGGVSDQDSVKRLKQMNIEAVIIGKAIYEGLLNLEKLTSNSNLAKRVIPCLDVKDGRVVKGIKFNELTDSGDPVELARYYSDSGADELVFLDISATNEGRQTMLEVVRRVGSQVFIPLTVGGGISTIEQIKDLLNVGADKVSINSAAVKNPNFIKEASRIFGSQCIVCAIDAVNIKGEYRVSINAGTKLTSLRVIDWVKEVEQLGAGEILLTSMDKDGTKSGYDLELLKLVSNAVNIPIIASGGAGSLEDFADGLKNSDAVLAASLFHTKELNISTVKQYLQNQNLIIRI